jgi:peptidoglycan/xylan/chitin deacetylase (PgdA/CDA1 family)
VRKPMLLIAGCAAALLAVVPAASAPTSFSGLDLSASDRLLFTAESRSPRLGAFSTLVLADLRSRAMRQLTFFPEEALLLRDQEVLQIRNRFGVFRTAPGFGGFAPVAGFPSFVAGSPVASGDPVPLATAPDGRSILFVRQRSAAYGDLVLLDAASGAETVVATGVELSLREPPALWSPDSRFFVYARGSTLSYFALAQLTEGRVLAEELRRVGSGRMANVRWGASGTLYYLDGSILYAIEPGELFTRALYSGYLPIGRVAGKIPFTFDPSFDSFHVAPDGRSVLLDKGGHNLFLYRLATGDFTATGNPVALPYLYLPRNTTVRRVAWSRANVITILCGAQSGGTTVTTIFRLVGEEAGAFGPFIRAAEQGVRDLVLSPDESKVALVLADGVSWKDYASWTDLGLIKRVSPLAALWIDDSQLLVAGAWTIERLRLDTGAASLVALSQVERAGHTADGALAAQARGSSWTFDEASGTWKAVSSSALLPPSSASAAWRVYLEPSSSTSYANLVMVRDAKGFGTTPLVAPEMSASEAFPAEDEPVDFGNFSHGSRIRRREVSLVFNAMQSDEGLAVILDTLAVYGITATFFVNGEFIRRYPDAVREIADSGHEVGSAFYRAFSMVDARFAVDAAFVQEGLAVNEDAYYEATGRELALLWHAPSYLVSSDIIAAGAAMNYTYVGRDLDPKDWVAATAAGSAPGLYQSAADLVERVVAAKRPGSIVPILVGPGEGPRDDYLFQKLDLLVNELVRLGYDIVPVSALIEHAR